MAHGKLEGPVNVHTNGRTAHAYFADGGRVTGWARGPAPAKMAVPEEAIVEKRKVQAEKVAAAEKRTAEAAEAERKRKPAPEKLRLAEPVATEAETKSEKAEVSSSEKPGSEIPAAVAEKQSEPPTAASPGRTFDEPTPISARPEIASRKSEPTQRPTAEPSVAASVMNEPPHEEITRESSPASTKKESPADVSLNTLVGPPSSLRTTTETSTPKKLETETSTSRDNAPLTEAEAIDLADTEARRQGAPLDDYQRPKVDHSAVKGKWTLFYGLKEGGSGGAFTVTVEDKTKKVEIRK
jgi:hypothetical protein